MKLRTAQRHPYALFYENKERGCIFMRLKCLTDIEYRSKSAGYHGEKPDLPPAADIMNILCAEAGEQPWWRPMTEKELRRLSRAELLEMLLAQTEENRQLKRELKEARDALSNRQIAIEESGTMAEAALKLNGVFEAADRAVQQYLENIERVMRERREGS